MIHFFVKTKIHLDAFTSRQYFIHNAPVVNAMDAMPSWWRDLPKERYNFFYPTPTMKTCAGVIEYYKNSIVLPLWSDLCISIEDDFFRYQFSDNVSSGISHDKIQYGAFLENEDYCHLKITSPWLFSSKEDVNWLVTEPIYNRKNFRDYTFAQGILNFKHQSGTNIQLFIDMQYKRTFIIPFRTPFLLTPMSEKNVVIHRHLISEADFLSKQQRNNSATFINKYLVQKKIKSCPFNWRK